MPRHSRTTTPAPNFFIIGAPKCGTTSLYEYLRTHPNVFMPAHKEPHYFARGLVSAYAADLESYLGLFRKAGPEQHAIGEASTHYLRCLTAIRRIREFNPDAKLVAMVRNPIDLAYSWHGQVLWDLHETETSFETAWRLQENRRAGQNLPPDCRWPDLLQYGEIAKLGEQVDHLLGSVARQRVLILLFDDLKRSPALVYDKVLTFLGLPHDGRTDFRVANQNKTYRSKQVGELLRKPPRAWQEFQRFVQTELGIHHTGAFTSVRQWHDRWNSRPRPREPLSIEFRRELASYFGSDVAKLGQLLDRDLSHWLRIKDEAPVASVSRRHTYPLHPIR